MEKMLSQARSCFQSIYGPEAELKSLQIEALQHLAQARNIFAGLPTGYGKSLCYWLPAKAWSWRVLVISPLVSLIEDQKRAMDDLGISTVVFYSGQDEITRVKMNSAFLAGAWNICFISPERLAQWRDHENFSILLNLGLDLLVLDEMHCLEEWRDFREGYYSIYEPIKRVTASGIPLLGLSASMGWQESETWMRDLCDNPHFIHTKLGRENIFLQIIPINEESHRWMLVLNCLREIKAPGTVLIYCATRAEVDNLCHWLNAAGIPAISYHAGIPPMTKKIRSHSFREGHLRVVCCTSAFGMGVDYSHVVQVIHFSLPYNLNSYWQEVGRAGRDGKSASALCFLRRSEILRARKMNEKQKKAYAELWQAFISSDCRKISIAKSLGAQESPCGNCDNCMRLGLGVFLSQMQEMDFFLQKNIWWLESSAEIQAWVHEKIFID